MNNNYYNYDKYNTHYNNYNNNCYMNKIPPQKESILCSLYDVEYFLNTLQKTCNIVNLYNFFR